MQLVSASGEAVKLCRRMYEDGSPDVGLQMNTTRFLHLLSGLSSRIENFDVIQSPQSSDQKQQQEDRQRLKDLSSDLLQNTQKLHDVLQKATSTGSRRKALIAAIKWKLQYKRVVADLERMIQNSQNILDTEFLSRICSSNQAMAAKSEEAFSGLGGEIQRFIIRWSEGNRDLAHLISTEAEETRAHVTAELQRSRNQMQFMLETNMEDTNGQHMDTRDHVTAESTRVIEHFNSGRRADAMRKDKEEIRTRILSTIWFSEMNDRENRIKEVTEESVKWISFKPNDDETEHYSFDPERAETSSTAEDTCNQPTRFQNWLRGNQPVFWISGKPGSGKSSLIKFLIENNRTRRYLNDWKPDIMICRYFFIEICSNPLQRQLRGCLRTLLHQIWSQQPGTLDRLLLEIPELETKLSEHDWSLEELQRVLIHSLEDNDSAFCIFIDGLDEIDTKSEDRDMVVELVKRLADLANVKTCVSSRPENIFQQDIGSGKYPFLMTETLNQPGIISYAEKALKPYLPSDPDDLHHFTFVVDTLVHKSSGVFLWIRLATRSVIDGLRNKDAWAVISERTDDLESDLDQLYQQMWQRQNLNHERYRKDTARLLWHAIHADNLILLSLPLHGFGTILAYIFATHEALSAAVRRLRTSSADLTEHQWLAEEHRILIEYKAWLSARSAGLLELDVTVGASSPSTLESISASIIHRSVKHFLLNTANGRKIISHGQTSMKQRLLQTLDVVKWVSCYSIFCPLEEFPAAVVSLAKFGIIDSDEELSLLKDFEPYCRKRCKIRQLHAEIEPRILHMMASLLFDFMAFDYIVSTTSSAVYLSHEGHRFKSIHKSTQLQIYRNALQRLREHTSTPRRKTFDGLICYEHWEITGVELPMNNDYTYLRRHVQTLQWFFQSCSIPDLILSEFQVGPLKLNSDTFYQYLWAAAYWVAGYRIISRFFPHKQDPAEYVSALSDCLNEYERHAHVLDQQICYFAAPAKDQLVYSWGTDYDDLVAKYSTNYEHAIVFSIRTRDLSEGCHALTRDDYSKFTSPELREKLRGVKFHVKCLAVRNGNGPKESENPAGWRTPNPRECDVVCHFFEDRLLKDLDGATADGNTWYRCEVEGDFSMLIPDEI